MLNVARSKLKEQSSETVASSCNLGTAAEVMEGERGGVGPGPGKDRGPRGRGLGSLPLGAAGVGSLLPHLLQGKVGSWAGMEGGKEHVNRHLPKADFIRFEELFSLLCQGVWLTGKLAALCPESMWMLFFLMQLSIQSRV